MCIMPRTDYAQPPFGLPPTNTALAFDDFDDNSEGWLFFGKCLSLLEDALAPDTKNLLDVIARYAKNRAGRKDLVRAAGMAWLDATENVGGAIPSRGKFRATRMSVSGARLAYRFAEAILGRPLRTSPTLFTEVAELIHLTSSDDVIIRSSRVDAIKTELLRDFEASLQPRSTWLFRCPKRKEG